MMEQPMSIAVSAVSGQLGAQIVQRLMATGQAQSVGLARTPEKVRIDGLEVRPGEYSNQATLARSLSGIETLVMVSLNTPPDERTEQHRSALRAAMQAGVRRIIYTSVQGAEQGTAFSPVIQSNRQTEADINLIFETAEEFKEVINRPIKKVPSLRDITVANLFFENSTRTRISFELAEKRLSADVVNFSASSSSVKKGETLLDTVNNILSMKVDMVVMRHPAPGAHHFLSRHIDANIINAGDGTHEHPTQALLDAFSMREQLGDLRGKNIAIIGDIVHSRVALSNIFCLTKLGAKVRVCGPPT